MENTNQLLFDFVTNSLTSILAYKLKKYNLDETGVEPMTFCLQGKRATNCATRPIIKLKKIADVCTWQKAHGYITKG